MVSAQTRNISLSSWGRHPVIEARVARPEYADEIADLIRNATPESPILARGLGRSYGDSALNASGLTLDFSRMNRMLAFDDRTGLLTCEAGTSFDDILRTFVPRGWFPPVTPGTRFVTVGGAIAHDVHGKNHHRDGSLSRFVESVKLVTGLGETVECSRTKHPNLFRATIGGLGLTGIILEASFRLERIESALISRTTIRTRGLSHALDLFEKHDADYPYSVAWVDCLARGQSLGKGMAFFGKHVPRTEVLQPFSSNPLSIHGNPRASVPFLTPGWLLNRYTVGTLNRVYRRIHPRNKENEQVHYGPFFYPLDSIGHWNRAYGRRGFTQFQCALPEDSGKTALTEILSRSSNTGQASFLSVLKKMGPTDEGFLSFPMKGYTLTMDFPFKEGLREFLSDLTSIVMNHDGRLYLAKDVQLDPHSFRSMYPDYEAWRSVVASVNPDGSIRSEMANRLELI